MRKLKYMLAVLTILFCLAPIGTAMAEEYVDVYLRDITESGIYGGSAKGEARVLVSVSGIGAESSFVRLRFKFSGDLAYSHLTLAYESPNGFENVIVSADTARINYDEGCTYFDVCLEWPCPLYEKTDVFVLNFRGKEGGSTVLSVVDGTGIAVCTNGSTDFFLKKNSSIKVAARNEGEAAADTTVKLVLMGIKGVPADSLKGFSDSNLTVKIFSENPESRLYYYTTVNNVSTTYGGHRQGSSTASFILNPKLSLDYPYTVIVSGEGYKSYRIENVVFRNQSCLITTANFEPGDCDGNGVINYDDYIKCKAVIENGEYITSCDFNRDGVCDSTDLEVFGEITSPIPDKVDGVSVKTDGNKAIAYWIRIKDKQVTKYTVKYGTSKESLSETVAVDGETDRVILNGLVDGTTYYLAVAAENKYGVGEFSDVISFKFYQKNHASGGSGGGPVSMTVLPISANAGESFETAVKIVANSGLVKFAFRLSFDSTKLTLADITLGEGAKNARLDFYKISSGEYLVTISSDTTIKEDGEIARLEFKLKKSVSERIVPIYIESDPDNANTDIDGATPETNYVHGYVAVGTENKIPDVTNDGELNGKDITDIQNHLSGKSEIDEGSTNAGDMDNDSSLGMNDLNLLMSLIRLISVALGIG